MCFTVTCSSKLHVLWLFYGCTLYVSRKESQNLTLPSPLLPIHLRSPTCPHPAFSIMFSSLMSAQGKRADWSQVQCSAGDMWFNLCHGEFFSLLHADFRFRFSPSSPPPLPRSSIFLIYPRLFDCHRHLGNRWWVISSTFSFVHSKHSINFPLSLSFLFYLYLLLLSCPPFLKLFISLRESLPLFSLYRTCSDICVSMATQIPEASERAT